MLRFFTDSRNNMGMRGFLFICFFVWLGVTGVVLLTPAETVQQTNVTVTGMPGVKVQRKTAIYRAINDGDNWHVFWFFSLTSMAALLQRKPTLAASTKTLLFLSAGGLTMELIQETLIPGRSFEWRDLGMNTIGITAALTLVMTTRRLYDAYLDHRLKTGRMGRKAETLKG